MALIPTPGLVGTDQERRAGSCAKGVVVFSEAEGARLAGACCFVPKNISGDSRNGGQAIAVDYAAAKAGVVVLRKGSRKLTLDFNR